MADGKWIDGLGPGTPVAEAARYVLAVRFMVVRTALPLAVHDADRDVEHVHRLRVATRRAAAALRIFHRWLPERVARKSRRGLRGVRRAAGEARDWDVFAMELLERRRKLVGVGSRREQTGIDFLIGYAAGQRDAAQGHLVEAGQRYGPRLGERFDDAIEAVRDPHDPDRPRALGELGRVLLLELLRELEQAADQDLDDYEHLHQVRILGKQLRYAMEVVAGCFPAEFREVVYPRVEEMQEALGRANDSHVAAERLAALRERMRLKWPVDAKRYEPGLDALLSLHRQRLPQERKTFLAWWDRWRASDGPLLRKLLAPDTPAGRPVPGVVR